MAHSATGVAQAGGRRVKIVVAPQALKGSLDAPEVGEAIARGIRAVAPETVLDVVPVADGGEGTVAALVAATQGSLLTTPVTGPLGAHVEAAFGLLGPDALFPATQLGTQSARGHTAVIEMASASGLPLVPSAQRDPRITTTRGTGELILAALDAGATDLLLGIGGSATNDAGAGMLQALGVQLLDRSGMDLPPGGAALSRLDRIAIAELDARLRDTAVVVACDVNNPLCGPNGASAVYGPQKGASPEMVAELDAALAHFADIVARDLGVDVRDVPGAGAAGGLGAALVGFLSAELVPGADTVLHAVGFARRLEHASLVFTAEGRLDGQTASGKAPSAVAALAQAHDIPVVVLCGGTAPGYERLYDHGLSAVVPIPDGPVTLEESMARAPELLARAAERAMRLVLVGRRLHGDAPS
jgi:glycerate kinase